MNRIAETFWIAFALVLGAALAAVAVPIVAIGCFFLSSRFLWRCGGFIGTPIAAVSFIPPPEGIRMIGPVLLRP
ncbi:hypothetical protein MesoLj113a_65800 [Mesorhizobium sp. 113-1-2]|nr:Uncharacterized protein MLTONO_5979 [Mesorhizobium loti]BCG75422.1 hypothetical protein MesoLj113a_65800 [Mesorhizobium sp. 113-1-2]